MNTDDIFLNTDDTNDADTRGFLICLNDKIRLINIQLKDFFYSFHPFNPCYPCSLLIFFIRAIRSIRVIRVPFVLNPQTSSSILSLSDNLVCSQSAFLLWKCRRR